MLLNITGGMFAMAMQMMLYSFHCILEDLEARQSAVFLCRIFYAGTGLILFQFASGLADLILSPVWNPSPEPAGLAITYVVLTAVIGIPMVVALVAPGFGVKSLKSLDVEAETRLLILYAYALVPLLLGFAIVFTVVAFSRSQSDFDLWPTCLLGLCVSLYMSWPVYIARRSG